MAHQQTEQAFDERIERLRMIRDSAAILVPRDGDLRRVRALRFTETGIDRLAWGEICAMGWPGLRLSETQGGSGLGMSDYVALLEELGRGLRPEPLIETSLVAALLPKLRRESLLAGEQLILPAGLGYLSSPTELPELREGQLHGTVKRVALGLAADAYLVATRTGLALVERAAPALQITGQPTQDGGHYAQLDFTGTPARAISTTETTTPTEVLLDEAALACAAYLVGLMTSAYERTLEYLKVRRQFGREIGSFQALQHRMVDLKIQVELSRAIVVHAAATIDRGAAGAERQRLVSAAKVRSAEAALLITRQSIQLHGGIGYADEADIGLFLRRAMVLLNAHGTLAFHKTRYATHLSNEAP